MGFWGWIRWHRQLEVDDNPVEKWSAVFHWWAILLDSILALGLGYTVQLVACAPALCVEPAATFTPEAAALDAEQLLLPVLIENQVDMPLWRNVRILTATNTIDHVQDVPA